MIVPTVTRAGELAVNGMSYSRRRGLFANAGLVVEVRPEDVDGFDSRNPLAFVAFQEDLERRAFIMGGGANQQAPAQRMTDFMTRSVSADLPETSYLQGLNSAPLHELFAPALTNRLREALALFDRRLKGFLTRDAVLIGVESRTSAPVRILRHPETLMHPQVAGLFPCGEGAGYAGGITSSALDGQRVARQAARFVTAGLPG